MNIPNELQQAIDAEIQHLNIKAIHAAQDELSARYRRSSAGAASKPFITSHEHRCAYLITRLPATYAAIVHVLQELCSQASDIRLETMLDVGAGPGSAMWAAQQILPNLNSITLLEKDLHLLQLGQRLAAYHPEPYISNAEWLNYDLEKIYDEHTLPTKDLVILSYSIGELSPGMISNAIEKCWKATKHFLIIIEPGTMDGFDRIRKIRQQIIVLGGYLLAPCPHAATCPIGAGDWCHFAARLERSNLHRRMKAGSLGYEDEKFSYLIFSKTPGKHADHRIIRHPIKHSGHVSFTLCTANANIAHTIISKKSKDKYKAVRHLAWGSSFP